jgi:4-alpha-glucanotransferase
MVQKATGAAIPLGAIRTNKAIGEFSDLPVFAEFCKKADLKIIQLLPVNDSGTDSSPYNALSAFALNPVYLTIEDMPECASSPEIAGRVKKLHSDYAALPRFPYLDIRREKTAILRLLYEEHQEEIAKSPELKRWMSQNEWIISYAVYMEYKRTHLDASWKEWPEDTKNITSAEILERWNDTKLRENHLFFAWVQFNADRQFKKAAEEVSAMGIILKGDIPIMMAEDSCDVWAHRNYFDHAMRAGAPPDMFNTAGQNWGFPTYKWDNLAKDDYSWWKERLKTAAQYYKAYRIDHILGFFRIWKTPEEEITAALGRPDPLSPITQKELLAAGFTEGRIHWLSEPHIPTQPVLDANYGDYLGTHGILHIVADRIGYEELWLFKSGIRGDRDILKADIPQRPKDVLLRYWLNRVLVKTGKDQFSAAWNCKDSTAWQNLTEAEKTALEALFKKKNKKMEKLWEEHARTILESLTKSAPMIPCAEDLGVDLECLPPVLKDLNILSLRVVRWAKDWEKPGNPFVPFEDYPELSVATTSVHDSSTLRGWWEKENGGRELLQNLNPGATEPMEYTPERARLILAEAATAKSALYICPIQDFLGLVNTYRAANPDDERVNIPGTVSASNWTYRLPVPVSVLLKDKKLISQIADIAAAHASAIHGKASE